MDLKYQLKRSSDKIKLIQTIHAYIPKDDINVTRIKNWDI